MKIHWLLAIALLLPLAAQSESAPETEEQKTLYLYGVGFGKSLKTMYVADDELEFIQAGMTDGFRDKALKVTPAEGVNPMVRSDYTSARELQ